MWLEILAQKIALNQNGKIEWFFGHWHGDFDFKVELDSALDSIADSANAKSRLQINAHCLYEEALRISTQANTN